MNELVFNIIFHSLFKQIFWPVKVLLILWIKGSLQIISFFFTRNRTFLDPYNLVSPHCWAISYGCAAIDTCHAIFLVWRYCNGMFQICFIVCQSLNKKKHIKVLKQKRHVKVLKRKLQKNWSLFRNNCLS